MALTHRCGTLGMQVRRRAPRSKAMQQQAIWRWVFRDPVTGRIRTDGRMIEREAARYPGAMRVSGFGGSPRSPNERSDFEDTQAGSFQTRDAHID